jgi:hypothetical protein
MHAVMLPPAPPTPPTLPPIPCTHTLRGFVSDPPPPPRALLQSVTSQHAALEQRLARIELLLLGRGAGKE